VLSVPPSELSSEEANRYADYMQKLAGGITCSPFTDEPVFYVTGMDQNFRPTQLYEIFPIR